MNKHPGFTRKLGSSFGYRSDGKLYSGKAPCNKEMEKFGTGDIIGCGINFFKREIFFTNNGKYDGPAFK